MKNTEFLETMIALGKISHIAMDYFKDEGKVNNSPFKLSKYYQRMGDKFKIERYDRYLELDEFFAVIGCFINRGYTKEVEERIFKCLGFLLDTFTDDYCHEDILDDFGESDVNFEDDSFYNDFRSITYTSNFGMYLRINGEDLEIEEVLENNKKSISFKKNDIEVYKDVLYIEYNLDTNEVKVICGDRDKDRDNLFKDEDGKYKVFFKNFYYIQEL